MFESNIGHCFDVNQMNSKCIQWNLVQIYHSRYVTKYFMKEKKTINIEQSHLSLYIKIFRSTESNVTI